MPNEKDKNYDEIERYRRDLQAREKQQRERQKGYIQRYEKYKREKHQKEAEEIRKITEEAKQERKSKLTILIPWRKKWENKEKTNWKFER